MKEFDISIVGAGVTGMTLALLLAKQNLRVCVCDAKPAPSGAPAQDGRSVALLRSSLAILDDIADLTAIPATPLSSMRLVDEHGGGSTFHADELGEPYFGLNIPLRALEHLLAQKAVETPNITMRYSTVIDDLVRAKNMASLVVAADGRNSPLPKQAGISMRNDNPDQTAMTCVVAHTNPHHNESIEFHKTGGPCTFVPMAGNYSNVVWVERKNNATHILTLTPIEQAQQLKSLSQGMLGDITNESPLHAWPILSQQAARLTADSLVLVGETAHVVSPIGAQGLNMSLADIDSLSTCIANGLKTGLTCNAPSILAKYERTRLPRMLLRGLAVQGLNHMVRSDLPVVQKLRRVGLGVIPRIAPLRNLMLSMGMNPAR